MSKSVRILGLVLLALALAPSTACKQPQLVIDSPEHGSFLNGTQVTVSGRALQVGSYLSFTVNGVPVPAPSGGDWSVDVPVDPAAVFNPLEAEIVLASGLALRDRVTVVVGDGVTSGFVLDGEHAPDAVAMRIADTGLAQIAPVVESLSGDAIDIGSLITDQNPIAQGSFGGISYTANAVDVSMGGFALAVDTGASGLDTTITIDDLFLEIDLELGILGSCTLEIETSSAAIAGSFDLAPLASAPSFVDVNLVSGVGVTLGGFGSQFVSGACNDPLIGDIVNLIIGQGEIQQLMEDGFESNLGDPDGAGPDDSPLAAAIQDALAGISIAGPVGDALQAQMDAPIASIDEDVDGLTILADAAITALAPHPDAPDLPAAYVVSETLPAFGPLTPEGELPYGLAFAISSSGMNQLLKAQIENGLLQSEITEFLGFPLTVGALALFIPELAAADPSEPVVIRIRPTLAPVMTGAPGPGGELAELKIAALRVEMEFVDLEEVFLAMEVDMDAGVDLAFTPAGLEFTLASPEPADIDISIVHNPIHTDETSLAAVFQQLFPLFAPELENAVEAFPIPSLLGLDLQPVEVARLPGGFIGLFADLALTPTTSIQNVAFSDLSPADWNSQGGCWLQEWRHRLAGTSSASALDASFKGMVGADAGCTTNDAQTVVNAHYRVTFDVVAVPGEQWTLAVDHSILGAFNRISDGYNDGIGFQDGGGAAWFQGDVRATWSTTLGGSGSFDFAASPTGLAWDGIGGSSSSEDVEFSGQNGVVLQGTQSTGVQLDFYLDLEAFSDSNTAFPTANGDELAIRLGKNDTIDNNFTAGSYPGMGGRNIADDGHRVSVELTTAPAP